ncbi:MAG TPA: hypothetical protein QGH10_08415 [Armatimonadota bacterium]|nr:hypothetical protein [Armatimonadota bacterium]
MQVGLEVSVLPAFIAAGMYWALNSFGVALLGSTTAEKPTLRIWSDTIRWTVIPFYAGGAAVMVVHLIAAATGPFVWFALIPTACVLHVAMDFRAKARIAQLAEEKSAV